MLNICQTRDQLRDNNNVVSEGQENILNQALTYQSIDFDMIISCLGWRVYIFFSSNIFTNNKKKNHPINCIKLTCRYIENMLYIIFQYDRKYYCHNLLQIYLFFPHNIS